MADPKSAMWDIRFPTPVGKPSVNAIIVKLTSVTPGSTNDTLKLCQSARNITVVDAYVQMSDGDTNATPTLVFSLQVTDGTTTKTIIHQSTAGQAGGLVRPTKVPATEDGLGFTLDNENYWFRLLWVTQAATAAAVSITTCILVCGWYNYGAVTE